jgi:23S rRNA pseudouridine1911/1915/1917 synthase
LTDSPPQHPADPREQRLAATVPEDLAGRRLDQALAALFAAFSRTRLQGWVRAGRVTVDGAVRKARDPVYAGERIALRALLDAQVEVRPEAIALDIRYEDDHLLVIDKPAGLVVHPAAGNPDGTVQNALLHHAPGAVELPRAGIVHRLDKDTTGLMVVAKTPLAHRRLVEALQARAIKREYRALVQGLLTAGGTVAAPVGRHPTQRTRMAVHPLGKPAVTHYRVAERFRAHTLLDVRLETGRTHQIRVHMAHIRHPIVGDPVYGARPRLPAKPTPELVGVLQGFRRQALHAWRLSLEHPATGEPLSWEAQLPADFAALLAALRADADGAAHA